MSLTSKAIYLYFKLQKRYSSEAFEKLLLKRKESFYLRKLPLKARFEAKDKVRVIYFNEESKTKTTVIYLHGGAYVNTFSPFHFKFMKKLISKSDCKMIALEYRLAPFATYKEAISFVTNFYKQYITSHKDEKIILMGDSAGGGLALISTFALAKENISPDELVLISPWVDLSMDNPKIDTTLDPWLYKSRLSVCASYWADGLDLKDPKVSPLYDDLSKLKNVTLFSGTKEIIYDDTLRLFGKLKNEPSNKLIVKDKMIHVYPILPIKEAKQAINMIVDIIKR